MAKGRCRRSLMLASRRHSRSLSQSIGRLLGRRSTRWASIRILKSRRQDFLSIPPPTPSIRRRSKYCPPGADGFSWGIAPREGVMALLLGIDLL